MAIDLMLLQIVAVLFKLPQLKLVVQGSDAVDAFVSAHHAQESPFDLGIFLSEGLVQSPECFNDWPCWRAFGGPEVDSQLSSDQLEGIDLDIVVEIVRSLDFIVDEHEVHPLRLVR